MTEKNDKQNQNDKEISSKSENFLLHELKARAEIRKQSLLFKKAVDDEKAKQLRNIEEKEIIQEHAINDKCSKLEEALKGDDPESIKDILKNMQI